MQDDYSICQGIVSHYCKVRCVLNFCNVTSHIFIAIVKKPVCSSWYDCQLELVHGWENFTWIWSSIKTFIRDVCVNFLKQSWRRWRCQLNEKVQSVYFHRQIGGGGIILDALVWGRLVFLVVKERKVDESPKALFSTRQELVLVVTV